MVGDVAAYVPGYRLKQQVQITEIPADQPVETLLADGETARPTHQVSVFLEVEGAAHYLPGVRRQPRHHDLRRPAGRRADRGREGATPQ